MKDKYISYSSIALAGEETFVRWVRHGENGLHWQEWLAAHKDKQSVFDEARRIVLAFDSAPQAQISETEKEHLWNAIDLKIRGNSKVGQTSKIKGLWTWGIAAAASLALLFWVGSGAGTQNIFAEAGEHKEIVLPEKSIVTLNAESRIAYKEKSFETDRVLHLEGEAFFDVEPGSTFQVISDEGTVTVVGTSFNVLARDGRFEVSCYTGKVSVEVNAKNKTELTTGLRAGTNTDNAKLKQSTFDATSGKPEWKTGKFRFEDSSFADVVREFERQYDVDIILENGLEEVKYTGLFESGDLAKALQLITWPLHLESSIKGKTITITR